MTTITTYYAEQNRRLHESNPAYGTSGQKWAEKVYELACTLRTRDVLDYGCGKETLKQRIPFVRGYDPAIEGLDAPPEPAELVICTDVLEHIEPECLGALLDELQRVTLRTLFMTVATGPAKKFLPDGRNAHLIQEGQAWWLPKIMARFYIRTLADLGHEIVLTADAFSPQSGGQ